MHFNFHHEFVYLYIRCIRASYISADLILVRTSCISADLILIDKFIDDF